jgi:biopolymer transport protein ExbB
MKTEWTLAALAVIAMFALLAPVALAGDEAGGGEDEEAGGKEITWMDTIMASGLCGAVIILISVITLALAIEHFVNLRWDKLMPPEILSEVEVLFEDEEFEEAMELCEQEPSYFTNIVGAALPKMNSGYSAMLDAIADASSDENQKLFMHISYLSVASAEGPMLGLLGTVQGMIQAFQKIASSRGAPDPSELSGAISLALVTTFEGLIVAIPGTAFYFYFRLKVMHMTMRAAGVIGDLFDRFRPTE